MVTKFAEKPWLNRASGKAPLAVAELEGVAVSAGDDRLERQSRQLLMNGEVADRLSSRGRLDVNDRIRDCMPGAWRSVFMMLDVGFKEASDLFATDDSGAQMKV